MLRVRTKTLVVGYLLLTFFLDIKIFSMDADPNENSAEVAGEGSSCTNKKKRRDSIKKILADVDKAFEERAVRDIVIDHKALEEEEYIKKLLDEYENQSVTQVLEESNKEKHLEDITFDMLLAARDRAIADLERDYEYNE